MTATGQPSTAARVMTWLAVSLSLLLLVLGIIWYGFSAQVHQRFWSDIFERLEGPMSFRFYLQPGMAFLAALHDGLHDVRHGHKSFFWSGRGNASVEHGRLREGLTSVARVILLGICMDIIYQFKVLDRFYPAEAFMMALLLAVIPYFVFRWCVERVARWWFARKSADSAS